MKSDIQFTLDRFFDLQKQGFMKLGRKAARLAKPPKPVVSCDRCQDWHRQGEHTKSR